MTERLRYFPNFQSRNLTPQLLEENKITRCSARDQQFIMADLLQQIVTGGTHRHQLIRKLCALRTI